MAKADDATAAMELARRVVPELAYRIGFEHIAADADTFAVVGDAGGNVVVKGSSAIAMCVGLNTYLRDHLGVNVTWYASQPVRVPGTADVAPLETPLTGKAAVADRFFLNYCTFGYTTAFWTWTQWERFIDWMALNGINMPLAMTGQEKVWFETWRKLGLPADSVMGSFTGPAHLPWHWMANIESFEGPLTRNWLDRQEALQRQILARGRRLGMRPVLPAFSGHVPGVLKTVYPEARVTLRESWCGFNDSERTWFLDPSDSLFNVIQRVFVETQDSIYGTDHIYGVDPFNEIESPDWSEDFLRNASARIYASLTHADSRARWLQMTWTFYNDPKHWTKPRIKAFLEGVPDDGLILLDYYCEVQPVWQITEAYYGKPYILCYLGNFGGNTMIVGDLNDLDRKINDFMQNGGPNAAGLGGTLEGLDVNPLMHEFLFAKAWNPELTPERWIEKWAGTRGSDPSLLQAWRLLGDKVLVDHARNGQGGLTNVRPSLTRRSAGCATAERNYDNGDLLRVLDLLLEARTDNDAYAFDVMNVTRQLLANRFLDLRDSLAHAYNAGNTARVRSLAATMDSMMSDLDALMTYHPDFSLRRWIEQARTYGADEAEKDMYEKNARTLLTTWGHPGTVLNDYANRHWSGLIDSFYRERWRRFADALTAAMEAGRPFDEDEFKAAIIEWEGEWTDRRLADDDTDSAPRQDLPPSVVDFARTLCNRYFH